MFAALLVLLPALGALRGCVGQEEMAVASCVEAVRLHFPCETQMARVNHTCLCEQNVWSVACFDQHAAPLSEPGRKATEEDANRHCEAAGSSGADIVLRKRRLRGRQIAGIISDIAGQVTSLLVSNRIIAPPPTAAAPTAIAPTAAAPTAANSAAQTHNKPPAPTAHATAHEPTHTTALASSVQAAPSTAAPANSPSSLPPNATRPPTPISTSTSTSAANSTQPSSPTKKSPSIGLIIGAALGAIIGLALLSTLAMSILRHRNKHALTHTPMSKEAFHPTHSYDDSPSPSHFNHHTEPAGSAHPPLPLPHPVATRGTTRSPSPFIPQDQIHVLPQPRNHNPPRPHAQTHTPTYVALPPPPPPSHAKQIHGQYHHAGANELATSANIWELDGSDTQRPLEMGGGRGARDGV